MKEKIISLRSKGFSVATIAKLIKTSRSLVTYHLEVDAVISAKSLFGQRGYITFAERMANPILSKHLGRDKNREVVRERDNFTCQNCKKIWTVTMRRFDVHHLDGLCGKKSRGYDRVGELKSLITLCHKCHYNHPTHSMKK